MTREEARRYWTARYEAARKWDDPHLEASERKEHRRYVDALNMAIEALQNLSKPNNGLQGSDLISRQDALEYFMTNTNWHDEDGYPIEDWDDKRKLLEDYFNGIPSADRPTGEWIEVEVLPEVYDIEGIKSWGSKMQCDQCGFRFTAVEGHIRQYNYCPNCGVKMGG